MEKDLHLHFLKKRQIGTFFQKHFCNVLQQCAQITWKKSGKKEHCVPPVVPLFRQPPFCPFGNEIQSANLIVAKSLKYFPRILKAN